MCSHSLTPGACKGAQVTIDPSTNMATGWMLNLGSLSSRFGGVTVCSSLCTFRTTLYLSPFLLFLRPSITLLIYTTQTYFAIRFDTNFETYGTWSDTDIYKTETFANGTDILLKITLEFIIHIIWQCKYLYKYLWSINRYWSLLRIRYKGNECYFSCRYLVHQYRASITKPRTRSPTKSKLWWRQHGRRSNLGTGLVNHRSSQSPKGKQGQFSQVLHSPLPRYVGADHFQRSGWILSGIWQESPSSSWRYIRESEREEREIQEGREG